MSDPKKPEVSNATKRKREEKLRRRDSKALENVLKEINTLSDQQKFEMLCTKYGELYEEFRICHSSLQLTEKKCNVLQRDNDHMQSEQSKLVLTRSRMESLCRELQKQNKLIKEENLVKIREEEEKRKEVAAKFQVTLNEVTAMMQENTEKNIKLRDDNLDMACKIESLYKQFEQRKEHQSKIEQQLELERQLAQAQIDKSQLELKAQQELWAQERNVLEDKCNQSEKNCVQFQQTIKSLKENLDLYSGKYQEFKTSVSKSNQVFDDCKSEMGKMTKQIASLEKEVKVWKHRTQTNAHAVLQLSEYKKKQEIDYQSASKKLAQLQKLCRQLQIDRLAYLKLLKANSIEPPSQTESDENLTPPYNSEFKQTTKEQNLELLKDSLKVLQCELHNLQHQNALEGLEMTPLPETD